MQYQEILLGVLAFVFLLTPMIIVILVALLVNLVHLSRSQTRKKQLQFIENYQFSEGLKSKFAKNHIFLDEKQQELVFTALKDYFYLCHQAELSMVSMPSQIVDDVWHEFILFTQDYQDFCHQAFDRFLHHTPAEAMTTQTQAQAGIRRAWRLACAKEGINPRKPECLPLIFAIDEQLKIENGFFYRLDCLAHSSINSANEIVATDGYYFCGTHISCATGCAGISGDSGNSSGDSSHGCCGHSCGGGSSCSGGCSGGCGGGCGSG